MAKEISRNIRLGIFVIIGTAFIIGALYVIGNNQNLFGSTFRLTTNFYDVNGLVPGNLVRFGGINIGTVESVELTNDTVIEVVLVIKSKSREFIKKNAIVSIGTDGLMGNKLVNINAVNKPSTAVTDGDILRSQRALETEEMMRTLNRTNEDIAVIARNLKNITEKVNSQNSLWSILMDTVVAQNVKDAIVNIKLTSNRTAMVSGDLRQIMVGIKNGEGVVGALLTDTLLSKKLNQTIVNIKFVSDTLALISGDLKVVSESIRRGDGAIGTILMDTSFVNNLNQTMENIRNGTKGFDENMEALKHNFLLRGYFKKVEKSNQKK